MTTPGRRKRRKETARIMRNAEVKENLAWAERVRAAPDAGSLALLLASALADTSRDLLRERHLRKPDRTQ